MKTCIHGYLIGPAGAECCYQTGYEPPQIVTRKIVGMKQGFDANGDPGPGVTLEIALIEVKRLTAALQEAEAE